MLSLARVVKDWSDSGALNERVPIWGWLDDFTFLTKGGDVGMVMRADGVDFECLDYETIDATTKRMEAALRLLDSRFRVYQYLFRSNHEKIPHGKYANPIVDVMMRERVAYFEKKATSIFAIEIYFAVIFEGFRYRTGLVPALKKTLTDPRAGVEALRALVLESKQIKLIKEEIDHAHRQLLTHVRAFCVQVSDLLRIEVLPKGEAFRVLYRLINPSAEKRSAAKLLHDTHTDIYLADSALACYPHNLKLDDHFVRVMTMKEPVAQTWPLVLRKLYEVDANYVVTIEWQVRDNDVVGSELKRRQIHYHNSKTSMMSQLNSGPGNTPGDVLIDDSKEAMVAQLGECRKVMELSGGQFGSQSLTVVIYEREYDVMERASSEMFKVFSGGDGKLLSETINQINALFACFPGGYHQNHRHLTISAANNADTSFVFNLHTGEKTNPHLNAEYLAVVETKQGTPFYLNLHHADIGHTIGLGQTGAGKSFLGCFLLASAQKYAPRTFVFELGGSFEGITRLFGGSYVKLGRASAGLTVNPFCLEPTKDNQIFLLSFVKLLMGKAGETLTPVQDNELYHAIEDLYQLPREVRKLETLTSLVPADVGDLLRKWVAGGPYDFAFDNVDDTLTFATFQGFDFENLKDHAEVLEPFLYYILYRANQIIYDPALTTTLKVCVVDECWRFLGNETTRRYIMEALKTWRKKNALMILLTQSQGDLERSQILDVLVECCPTQLFLANPQADEKIYKDRFHLTDVQVALIRSLVSKQQFLIKRPGYAKVLNLFVDPKSYWLYTNDPNDNAKRDAAFAEHGFEKGLEFLARSRS